MSPQEFVPLLGAIYLRWGGGADFEKGNRVVRNPSPTPVTCARMLVFWGGGGQQGGGLIALKSTLVRCETFVLSRLTSAPSCWYNKGDTVEENFFLSLTVWKMPLGLGEL